PFRNPPSGRDVGGASGACHASRALPDTSPVSVVLSARGLTMRFGGFTAVDGVDLDVQEGELHALVGPNGAGKSTLLNLLGGQLLQTSGEIDFLGRSLGKTTPHSRARLGIGRSFQLTSVVAGFTCLENALLAVEARHTMAALLRPPPRGEDAARASEGLERVALRAPADGPREALGPGPPRRVAG